MEVILCFRGRRSSHKELEGKWLNAPLEVSTSKLFWLLTIPRYTMYMGATGMVVYCDKPSSDAFQKCHVCIRIHVLPTTVQEAANNFHFKSTVIVASTISKLSINVDALAQTHLLCLPLVKTASSQGFPKKYAKLTCGFTGPMARQAVLRMASAVAHGYHCTPYAQCHCCWGPWPQFAVCFASVAGT